MRRIINNALRALILISSITPGDALAVQKRALIIPSDLPGNWTSKGCYTDVGRTLTGSEQDATTTTIESCISYCEKLGYIYAGTEYSSQCFCGSSIATGAAPAPATDCNMACSGNATEACGGPSRLNLFWSGTTGPMTNMGPDGNWTFAGCYTEGTAGRALPNGVTVPGGGSNMTVSLCTQACQTAGFHLAGVEYAGECYCGNSIQNGATLAPDGLSGCSMQCNGNLSEFCGGPNRIDVYDFNDTVSLPPWTTITSKTTTSKASTSVVVSTSKLSSATTTKVSTTTTVKVTTTSKAASTTTTTSSLPQTTTNKAASTSAAPTLGIKQTIGAYSFVGCYTEATNGRALSGGSPLYDYDAMTLEECGTYCSASNFNYFGVEYGGECYCGNELNAGSVVAPATDCNFICPGTQYEYCGAGNRLELYKLSGLSTTTTTKTTTTKTTTTSSVIAPPPATSTTSGGVKTTTTTTKTTTTSAAPTLQHKPTVGPYTYQGCYTEATAGRALSGGTPLYDYDAMTLEECEGYCSAQSFIYFGVEYSGECYCGNAINAGSVVAPLTDCSNICPGNQYEYCGSGNRLDLYKLNGVLPTTTTTTKKPTTTTTGPPVTSTPATSGLPTGWAYQGCYVDGLNGRDLNHQQPDSQTLTVESCVKTCVAAGYTIAGMEFSTQCFCDNFLYNGAALAANQADCNMPCAGDSTETCGAGNRLSIYSLGKPQVFQPPAAQTTGLPANWVYKGCLQDNIPSKEDANQILSTFPYLVWQNDNNSAPACIEKCQEFGFNAAGVEFGSQCFCGDVENILVASAPGTSTNPDNVQEYTRSRVPQIVDDSQCNAPCTGDSRYLCGSGNLMNYYAWDGPEPLYVWDFPTGNDAGEYSLLIGGVVVPLMTSQVVTGKVTFTEKYGSGEPNGTGAYELDLSEISNFTAAWRTMTGMDTDVFCSAGLTLPDKAGRQVTVGGWAGQSNFGIRLYWPDGSDGVPGKNEWQEDPSVLSLQVPRWYPSAMVMANGSIMIIGGEIGSNDAEQPTLELLPATGVPDSSTYNGYSNTTVYLEFLDQTAPFNLYPYVCVVPSGIFVAYYNQARILDEVTFQTKKILPQIPAAVNDPTGGRTYQLEGTMVLLPQHAPYTDLLGVLICGGSTSGGGYPIDNCVSTQPEAENPVWTIERMPSRRVMPCMAGLPDGTYVIVNGAQHGVAGFGLAGDPNYNAVLYDPRKPVNQRMSVMANTTVARLYHSEAIVLVDGRVLISGSDPTGDYTQPPGNFPEEYRVEVFTPPYLLSGLPRPTFTLSSKTWAYGESISFTVTSGTASAVSMLGSVVSTHGNAMGQRTLFPAFSCNGNTCTVEAPPNAHVAPPGWYMVFVLDGPTPAVGQFIQLGGDPANIGNWPQVGNFDLPGV